MKNYKTPLVIIIVLVLIGLWIVRIQIYKANCLSKSQVFEIAGNKLINFLESRPTESDETIEQKYNLGINYINSDELQKNYSSYKVIKESIHKRDLTDDYVVLNYEAEVLLDTNGVAKKYLFIIRFESTILSDSSLIPKSEVESDIVWAVRWKKLQ